MNLRNKHVLLTGASGGIGRALASELSVRGANIILVGRRTETLTEIYQELGTNRQPEIQHNKNVKPAYTPIQQHKMIVADLNCPEDRQRLISDISTAYPNIDVLINNAGISEFALFENMPACRLDNLLQSNLIAPMQLTRLILPLLNAEKAHIVNIGSVFGTIGHPGFTAYCASKFGLRGFSEALSRELADRPVVVQHIAPRSTQTSINSVAVNKMNTALGNRTDSPQWVATKICNAIEKESMTLTLGWPEKLLVKLNTLFSLPIRLALKTQLPTIKRYAEESSS